MKDEIKEIRNALADYIATEGCTCCENIPKHDEAKRRLGKLLKVPKYKDGSGYNFLKFKSN